MKYVFVIESSPDGSWWAFVPDLPGCTSAGDSPEDVRRSIGEAIALHIESLREHNEPVPAARARPYFLATRSKHCLHGRECRLEARTTRVAKKYGRTRCTGV